MNNTSKTPLTKEELVERLKAIATDDTPRIEHPGAMCYCPLLPTYKHTKCDDCGCDIIYDEFDDTRIKKTVQEIAQLGYDVKLTTLCKACAEKLKNELFPNMKSRGEEDYDWKNDVYIEKTNYVFYFRTTADVEYHRAISNNIYQYKALLTLMHNEPMYGGIYDESHYLADETDTLEYMTGIKFGV